MHKAIALLKAFKRSSCSLASDGGGNGQIRLQIRELKMMTPTTLLAECILLENDAECLASGTMRSQRAATQSKALCRLQKCECL